MADEKTQRIDVKDGATIRVNQKLGEKKMTVSVNGAPQELDLGTTLEIAGTGKVDVQISNLIDVAPGIRIKGKDLRTSVKGPFVAVEGSDIWPVIETNPVKLTQMRFNPRQGKTAGTQNNEISTANANDALRVNEAGKNLDKRFPVDATLFTFADDKGKHTIAVTKGSIGVDFENPKDVKNDGKKSVNVRLYTLDGVDDFNKTKQRFNNVREKAGRDVSEVLDITTPSNFQKFQQDKARLGIPENALRGVPSLAKGFMAADPNAPRDPSVEMVKPLSAIKPDPKTPPKMPTTPANPLPKASDKDAAKKAAAALDGLEKQFPLYGKQAKADQRTDALTHFKKAKEIAEGGMVGDDGKSDVNKIKDFHKEMDAAIEAARAYTKSSGYAASGAGGKNAADGVLKTLSEDIKPLIPDPQAKQKSPEQQPGKGKQAAAPMSQDTLTALAGSLPKFAVAQADHTSKTPLAPGGAGEGHSKA